MLYRCLNSLLQQSLMPCEIIVARRDGDTESREVIHDRKANATATIIEVVVGPNDNLLQSLNAAISASSGTLVALTDDDAEFPVDWTSRIITYFGDPRVGGVGGRDNQSANPGNAKTVGRLQWFGRVVGNHHLAIGPTRDVEVVKGVNCCFRGQPLREIGLDSRLRGKGNVSNWELGVCFAFLKRGYRLLLDPSLQVTHHIGPRLDGDINCRGGFNGPAHADSIFNETLLISEYLPMHRKVAFYFWAICIGTASAPGLFQVPRSMIKFRSISNGLDRFWHTVKGRICVILNTI